MRVILISMAETSTAQIGQENIVPPNQTDRKPTLQEQAQNNPHKYTLLRMLESPLATEGSTRAREQLANWAEKKRKETGKKFTAVLAGSAAYGFTPRDGDVVIFAEKADDAIAYGAEWEQTMEELVPVLNPAVVKTVDVEDATIEDICLRMKEASDEDIENISQLSPTERGLDRHNPTYKASRLIRDAYEIARIFGPTSFIDEQEGMVDQWRAEIIKTMSNRPDAEKIWEIVRQDWRYAFVEYELQPKRDAKERVDNNIRQAVESRFNDDRIRIKAEKYIRQERGKLALPTLEEMK